MKALSPPVCLIVDDSKVARLMLRQLLEKMGNVIIAGECEDALSAKKFLETQAVDILFLDIEMPEISGLELLRLLTPRPLTILITAKQGYAVEAFELNVVDYLVKPISLSRLMISLQRVMEIVDSRDVRLGQENSEEVLFIKDSKTIRKIDQNEILWMEAKGDYVRIQVVSGKNFVIHASLKNLEEKFDGVRFVRVHRSYILAVNKIDYIEDSVAYVHNHAIPISDTYKDGLLKSLHLL